MEYAYMIILKEMTNEHIQLIKKWSEYPPEFKELDYALRDGGWLDSNFYRAFSAIEEDIVIGFTTLWKEDENISVAIALHCDKIGKGLGHIVLCETLQICFSKYGCKNVYLDVRKSNIRAKRLYEKIGFRVVNEHVMEVNAQQVPFYKMVIEKDAFLNFNVIIRQLNDDEELKECVNIIREAFLTVAKNYDITQENCPTYAAYRTFSQIKAMMEDGIIMFVLLEQHKPVGFVCLVETGNKAYMMGLLSVHPEFRHMGYGRMLMDFIFNYVKTIGGEKVSIWLMNENKILKDWYSDYGFVETSTRKPDDMPFTICDMEKYVIGGEKF